MHRIGFKSKSNINLALDWYFGVFMGNSVFECTNSIIAILSFIRIIFFFGLTKKEKTNRFYDLRHLIWNFKQLVNGIKIQFSIFGINYLDSRFRWISIALIGTVCVLRCVLYAHHLKWGSFKIFIIDICIYLEREHSQHTRQHKWYA